MKFLARRAFLFSFVILIPFVGILNNSKIGNIISYNEIDTSSIKALPKINPRMDSMLYVVALLNQTNTKIDIVNSKIDTGLHRQVNYMQSQNLLFQKFMAMSDTINILNHQLKLKNALPNQIIKDAQTGNAQKEALRMILMIAISLLIIIGLLVAILVLQAKRKAYQTT